MAGASSIAGGIDAFTLSAIGPSHDPTFTLRTMAILRKDVAQRKRMTWLELPPTGGFEEREVVEGYRLGANAYVVKPVRFEDFVKAVSDLGVFQGLMNESPPGLARVEDVQTVQASL